MIEVNDAYHPDGKKLRFSFHNGRAEVQAFTPKATLVTLRCIKGSPFSPLCLHHSLFLPTTTTTLVLSHAVLRYPLSSPCPPSSVQVIRHDRLKHDVRFIGTIAFKHDSKFTGYIVSSGDTALGSVALVCGIGLYRSLEVASTSGCWSRTATHTYFKLQEIVSPVRGRQPPVSPYFLFPLSQLLSRQHVLHFQKAVGASYSVTSSLTHLSPTDHHNAVEPLNNTSYATLSTFPAMSWCYNDGRDAEEDLFTPGAGPSRSQTCANDESDEDTQCSAQPWPYTYIVHGGHLNPYVPLPPPSLPVTHLEGPTPFAPHASAQAAHWDDDSDESTGAWPFPVPVPATHAYTEEALRYVPVSTFSARVDALDRIEVPRRRGAARFSSLLDAVQPIRGPWSEMAREVVEAPRDIVLRVLAEVPPREPVEEVPEPIPELPPSPETASVPVPQAHHVDAEEGPRRKKARNEKGSEGEGEGQGGSQGGNGAKAERRIVRRPRMPPIAGCGLFSVRLPSHYAARGREMVGVQSQIPVVHPQAHDSAPKETTGTSTTSTHRVEIPIGEPVPEAVPQSIGGPWTTTPGEKQRGARKRKRADPHVCDGPDGCSKRLSCPYDMPRHKATLRHGGVREFACDDCPALFVRKDEVLRHMREHCPNRGRKHNGGGGPSQGPRHDGLEGGGGGMEGMGYGLLGG
ncbi:hypothetical protein HETIRDRAFT_448420 [Heterobasidion irregulare TC 32-1]|uniref:C2H2-type domain-containing protein n=1 Tax=Heterobasidion irregulare (strain TC 32-1) TaxID=747525 RepID=W4KHE5_HETIT|nr:uncharacterized protein HETIRDRAFT_448420 [Heterobasidion irregulare TC 32-1]ETW85257.1 hypothetical protein HETIRDRAFT_448420 [Heterobasidion irregulare TC 32-1]